MTKSHIAAIAAFAIAVPIITLQYHRNARLEEEAGILSPRNGGARIQTR